MKLGLLSDTHDNLTKLSKAVNFFNRKKVDFVLHAGDFVAPFCLNIFHKLNCEYLGVLGNNDGEKVGLKKKSQGKIKKGPLIIKKDGKKILLTHDISKVNLKREKIDLVVYGHSHKKEVRKEKGIMFVNPGECSGWLSGTSTVAIIDLETLKVEFFKL